MRDYYFYKAIDDELIPVTGIIPMPADPASLPSLIANLRRLVEPVRISSWELLGPGGHVELHYSISIFKSGLSDSLEGEWRGYADWENPRILREIVDSITRHFGLGEGWFFAVDQLTLVESCTNRIGDEPVVDNVVTDKIKPCSNRVDVEPGFDNFI